MTSKERVMTAVNHHVPDRTPIQTYLTPELMEKLFQHFNVRDYNRLLDILGVDLRMVNAPYVGKLIDLPPGSDVVDEWGVGYTLFDHGHGGSYPEPNHLALKAIETWEQFEAYPWPSPDDYDYSNIETQCDALSYYAVCTGHAGAPDIVNGVGRGRGMEQVLTDIMMQDPIGVAIIDKRCDHYYEVLRRTLEAGKGKIDIFCTGEDTGNQLGPMFPPMVFDDFFRPRLQRFYDLGHEFGCKVMMHSCGSTRQLMPRFVEMGLDILDAMQPEPTGMVPEEIKQDHGNELAFCGLISTQKTLPFGTVEDCRKEAQHRLTAMTVNGGYIFSPAHCIQADNPVENVLAIYEEALGLEPGAFDNGSAWSDARNV